MILAISPSRVKREVRTARRFSRFRETGSRASNFAAKRPHAVRSTAKRGDQQTAHGVPVNAILRFRIWDNKGNSPIGGARLARNQQSTTD
jgi:hypothetical protein